MYYTYSCDVCMGGMYYYTSSYILQDISKNFEFEKGGRDCNKKYVSKQIAN